MKNLLTLIAIALAVVVSSCSKFDDTEIWKTLNDHERRITALEELCKQMNTNIDALQTIVEALEKRDYITNVSPVSKDGGVIGYTITFAHSGTITIYHGENGKDGADGTGSYKPQIGVKKDADGIYYWTVDGEWLLDDGGNKIKATGEDGRDGQDGADGTDGSNGSDGKDGQDGEDGTDGRDGVDGVTPRLKIENDYWYVSYDDGATWIELGKATGEDGVDGSDGSDGADGDNMLDGIFTSITQDDEYVYFNLADGTIITLPRYDKEYIQFEDLHVKAICCINWDTNYDGELSYAEAEAVTDIGSTFSGNTDIIVFNEFKYFTGLTYISAKAFRECTSLFDISLPINLVEIKDEAFYNCSSLQAIEIPSRVTHIGESAFYICDNLKCVKIPKSVVSIDKSALYTNNGLKNVYIEDIAAWCKIQFGDLLSQPLYNGGNLYLNGELVTNLVIPNGITSISQYAFSGCGSILNLTICGDVATIDTAAFQYCKNLLSVNVLEGVDSIGFEVFDSCESLTTATLPSSLKKLGWRTFCFCNMLKYVYCRATTPPTAVLYKDWPYGWEAFPSKSGLKIYVPIDYSSEYKSAGEWKTYKNCIYEYDFVNDVPVE